MVCCIYSVVLGSTLSVPSWVRTLGESLGSWAVTGKDRVHEAFLIPCGAGAARHLLRKCKRELHWALQQNTMGAKPAQGRSPATCTQKWPQQELLEVWWVGMWASYHIHPPSPKGEWDVSLSEKWLYPDLKKGSSVKLVHTFCLCSVPALSPCHSYPPQTAPSTDICLIPSDPTGEGLVTLICSHQG